MSYQIHLERINESARNPNSVWYYILKIPVLSDYILNLDDYQFEHVKNYFDKVGVIRSTSELIAALTSFAIFYNNPTLTGLIQSQIANLGVKNLGGLAQDWLDNEVLNTDKIKNFENENLNKSTIIDQPPFTNNESNQKFSGFENKNHVALIGTTNSGKTTWLVSAILKGLFKDYNMFIYVGAKTATNDLFNLHKAVLYDLKTNKQIKEPKFVYFHTDQILDAIQFIETEELGEDKLCFFDDLQTGESRIKKMLGSFILKAKHANATVITTLHNATDKEYAKVTREACRYYVLFNMEENQFNFLLGLNINNAIYSKYKHIQGDKYQRVLIYDKENKKSFYGTGKNLEFDPLVAGKGISNEETKANMDIEMD
jgi:hypothetical protein